MHYKHAANFTRGSHLVKENSAIFSRAFHQIFFSSWVELHVGGDVVDLACKHNNSNMVTSQATRVRPTITLLLPFILFWCENVCLCGRC